MSKFLITGEELLEKYDLSIHDLVYLVNEGSLTPLESETHDTLTPTKLEAQFNQVSSLAKKPIVRQETKRRRATREERAWLDIDFINQDVNMEYDRIEANDTTEWLSLSDLNKTLLNDELVTTLPKRQYQEIIVGKWDNNILGNYLKLAVYKKDECDLITGDSLQETNLIEVLKEMRDNPPSEFKGQQKSAHTKSLNTYIEQIPKLTEAVFMLFLKTATPKMDRSPDSGEWEKLTKGEIIDFLKEQGIKRTDLQELIISGLPMLIKK